MTQTTRLCTAVGLAVAAMSASAAPQDADTARVVVTFKPGSKLVHEARALMARMGGQVKVDLSEEGAVAIELPKHTLAALRKHAAIAAVDEDAKRYLVPTMLSSASAEQVRQMALDVARAQGEEAAASENVPYGINLVQAPQVPASNKAPIKVCIIDSGLDRAHPDMAGNAMTGEFDSKAGNWYDVDDPHGTHVAGTIAAVRNGMGVVGVNADKEVQLHIVKVFTAAGWTYSSTLASAANKCKAAGAKIINMSLGGPVRNPLEENTFKKLQSAGILSIAAAGNDGNKTVSYPGGYASVMAVAAVDADKKWATFSQFNKTVEIAGPGVAVLSDVPRGMGRDAALTQGATNYAALGLDGAPVTAGAVTAPTFDFGLGDAVKPGAAGKHCLIQRGTIAFADKVKNCQASGGVGAIIYNNVPGTFGGTLGGAATTIPSVSISDTDGAAMLAAAGQNASLTITATDFAVFNGTSMASPHVVGVAARVWREFPQCTNVQIRNTLNKTAQDLGAAGRDTKYGWGLVQAKAAYDRLTKLGCAN